jgi:uncharacterized membrane protein
MNLDFMHSANRQAAIDRQMAVHDYEVNLEPEAEIMALQERIDLLARRVAQGGVATREPA